MDLKIVLEEIALEGLDGITLNALWLRLTARPDNNPGPLDDCVKEYIWKNLVCCRDLEFFKLPQPRPNLVILDFNENVYQCRCLLSDYPVDIYSIDKVEQDGVNGSCDHFNTRVSIIDDIRGKDEQILLTVKEASQKWGQQLVIVASQTLRYQALFGTNYMPPGISAIIYCLIERVGRSRTNGELTLPMPSGRGVINKALTASNMFAVVKYLKHRGILRKQPFNIRFTCLEKNCHVRLLHLYRFYRESKANSLLILQTVCNTLMEAPGQRMSRQALLATGTICEKDLKKHWTMLSKFVVKRGVDYREMYPTATEEEYKSKSGNVRRIIVFTLIKPFSAEQRKELEEEYEDDADDDEEEDDDDESQIVPGTGLLYDMAYPRSVQYAVDQAGPSGIESSKLNRMYDYNLKSVMRMVRSLIKIETVVNAPTKSAKAATSYRLVSTKYANESPLLALKGEPVEVEQPRIETDRADDSITAVAKEEEEEEDNDMVVDEEEDSPEKAKVDKMGEEELYNTLKELGLTWRLERPSTPKVMNKNMAKLMVTKKKKRRQFILKFLEKHRVCVSGFDLRKKILKWEAKQGMKETMCRKSYVRVIDELYSEDKLCKVVINCRQKGKDEEHRIFAATDIDLNEKKLKESILIFYTTHYKFMLSLNQNKEMRFHKWNEIVPKDGEGLPFSYSETLTRLSENRDINIKLFKSVTEKTTYPSTKGSDRLAKMRKARELHTFMFYLLYDYPEEARNVKQKESLDPAQMSETSELPVYLDVQDWRRHVPPLKIHNTKYLNAEDMQGKCMMGDLLMAMPIGVLNKIVQFDWQVEGLYEICNSPELSRRLLFSIPTSTLRVMCHKRRFIHKIISSFTMLCHMGLGTFGPSTGLRPLEYTVFYLHKKAMLLDTMKSLPGRLKTNVPEPGTEFPAIHFEFRTLKDLEVYWKEAHLICMSTALGSLDKIDTPGFNGEITLEDAVKPRPFEEIREDNWLPGDRRGAAGFDSSMFMHQMRNWDFKKLMNHSGARQANLPNELKMKPQLVPKKGKKRTASTAAVKKKVKKAKENLTTKAKAPSKRKKKETSVEGNPDKDAGEKREKRKRLRVAMDDEDRIAKKKLARLRALFTPFENGIEKSKDKTSSAIKGKSCRLIKDEKFLSHLGVYLAKARYDLKLMDEYKDFKFSLRPKHKDAMVKTFNSMVERLHVKFSSPEQLLPYDFPPTSSEFHRQFEIKLALDRKSLRDNVVSNVHFNVTNAHDIRASVLWEFILGWMHSNKTVCNILVYHILCQYSEEAVNKTHSCLKTCRVMYMHKKYRYIAGFRTLSKNNQVVSNLILSKRHKESLISRYPAALFHNVWKQLDSWADAFEKGLHDRPLVQSAIEGDEKDKDNNAMRNEQASSSHADKDGSPTCTKQESQGANEQQFIPLNIEEFQGGSLIAFLPMMAMDLLHIDITVPDDMVRLSKEGLKLLTLKKRDKNKKRGADDAGLDTSLEDSNDEEDAYMGATSVNNGKWKMLRAPAPGFIKRRWTPAYAKATRDEDDGDVVDDVKEKKTSDVNVLSSHDIQCGDVQIHYNQEHAQGSASLGDFTMAFASGTLLALARTSMLEEIDLLNTRVNVQRFFIVDPLRMKFALKKTSACGVKENGGNGNEAIGNDPLTSSSSNVLRNITEFLGESSECSGPEKHTSSEAKKGEKPEPGNIKVRGCLSEFDRPELYKKIMSRLEQTFPVDYASYDVHQELDLLCKEDDADGWVEKGRSLFTFIDSSGASGVTEVDLENKEENPLCSFHHILNKLCDMNAVFQMGIMELRYVSRQYMKVWMLEAKANAVRPHLSRQTQTDGGGDFAYLYQSRPWRNPEGVVNVRFLYQVLHVIMTHLIRKPGISLQGLMDTFNPDLLPTTCRQLVQILQDLGCITSKIITSVKKKTIFGKRGRVKDTLWLRDGHRVLDLDVSSSVRFSFFSAYLQSLPGWTKGVQGADRMEGTEEEMMGMESGKNPVDDNMDGEDFNNYGVDNSWDKSNDGVNDSLDKSNDGVHDSLDKSNDGVNDSLGKSDDAVNDSLDKSNDGVNDSLDKSDDAVNDSLDKSNDGV